MTNTELYFLFCYNSENPPQPITDFEIIIAGNDYPANMEKGALIITPINSIVLSNAMKDTTKIIDNNSINQISKIQTNFQVDIYKVNPNGNNGNAALTEALNIREWLKTFDVQEYLNNLNYEILPCYAPINFTIDYTDQKKLVNRCYFEFSIIENIETPQSINIFNNIEIKQNLLQGK